MERVTLLDKVPLFASLKQDLLAELAGKLSTREYRQGETIFHKDDPGLILYIIKEGQVKIITPSPEGEEVILAIFTNGDFFGELSLLDDYPRSASAVAIAPTRAYTLHRTDFLDFIIRNPELAIDMLGILSRRLRRTDSLVEDAVFLDLPARLAKQLLELSQNHGVKTDEGIEIDLHLTQQDLASLVGASRVAVNKQLGLFQSRGLIRIGRQSIILLRPDELGERIY